MICYNKPSRDFYEKNNFSSFHRTNLQNIFYTLIVNKEIVFRADKNIGPRVIITL